MVKTKNLKLICGDSNKKLGKSIAKNIGIELCKVETSIFSDGELYVRILESVRGKHVFILQPHSGDVNKDLIQTLLFIDACKRSSAGEITVLLPYFFYCRQDKQLMAREPITAKLMANVITISGADRVVSFDFHAGQIQGYFDIPTDNLSAVPLMAEYFKKKNLDNVVVVSPDAGGTKRARNFAKYLDASFAVIDKSRKAHNKVSEMTLIGDVEGKNAIIVDDIIDTAGTMVTAIEGLVKKGAKSVYVAAVHPVLSGSAIKRLSKCSAKEIVVTDTIPLSKDKKIKKIKVLSVAEFLAKAVRVINTHTALSSLIGEKETEKK